MIQINSHYVSPRPGSEVGAASLCPLFGIAQQTLYRPSLVIILDTGGEDGEVAVDVCAHDLGIVLRAGDEPPPIEPV